MFVSLLLSVRIARLSSSRLKGSSFGVNVDSHSKRPLPHGSLSPFLSLGTPLILLLLKSTLPHVVVHRRQCATALYFTIIMWTLGPPTLTDRETDITLNDVGWAVVVIII